MTKTESMIMSFKTFVLSLALVLPAAIGSAAGPALAMAMPDVMDVNCLARDTMSHYLDRAYGEGRIAQAELDNGNQVELFVSRSGTWTLVEMTPDGQGCVQAYGQHMKVEGRRVPVRQSPS